MRIFILFFIVSLASRGAAETATPLPIRVEKKFVFVNGQAKPAFPLQFDWAWPFTEGRAGVRMGKDWFLLDGNGKRVGTGRYDWVGCFSEGMAPARQARKWGYAGRDGGWRIEPYFSDARPFRDGVAAVQVGGNYTIVDKTDCFEGVVGVDLAPPSGDRMVPGSAGGKWGLIDNQGRYVREPSLDEIWEAKEGRIPFRLGSAWGFLALDGRILVEATYMKVAAFQGGWAPVIQFTGKSGFVNLQGQFAEHRPIHELETGSGP